MKSVLITGASSGFGYATTLLLSRKGYKVYAGVRDLQKKESLELLEVTKKENLSIQLLKLDITNQADIDLIPAKEIDILVNNAGLGYLGAVEEYSVEEIKEQFEINFYGAIRLIKKIAPEMRAKKNGTIISISSISGLISFPLYGIYGASKFALEAYSEALRFELYPFNIKVALIEPGSFLTGFIKNSHFPKMQSSSDSVYTKLTSAFFNNYRKFDDLTEKPSMAKMFNAEKVAQKILKVIQTKEPKFHNLVGRDARMILFAKQIIPETIYTFFLRKIYKWS